MPHPPRLDTPHPRSEYTRTIAPRDGYRQQGEAECHEKDVSFKLTQTKGSEKEKKEKYDGTGNQSCL